MDVPEDGHWQVKVLESSKMYEVSSLNAHLGGGYVVLFGEVFISGSQISLAK